MRTTDLRVCESNASSEVNFMFERMSRIKNLPGKMYNAITHGAEMTPNIKVRWW